MLEIKEDDDNAIIELVIEGHTTAAEYHQIAERALAFIEKHKRVRVLKVVRSFAGFDLDVFKEKLIFDFLKHMNDIIAAGVAADEQWIELVTNIVKPACPYPVKVFKLDQIDEARQWLKSIK